MPFGFRHPAPQVAATAPGMAPPPSSCSSDRGGADISPDLDREQDTELAVASDGGAEVLHPAHTPRRSRTQTGRPAPSIGPARWRWPTGRCRHEPGARLGLGSSLRPCRSGLVLANGPGVDLVERKTLEQVVGLGTREGGSLVLPGETAPFVLGLLEGPIELLAD